MTAKSLIKTPFYSRVQFTIKLTDDRPGENYDLIELRTRSTQATHCHVIVTNRAIYNKNLMLISLLTSYKLSEFVLGFLIKND